MEWKILSHFVPLAIVALTCKTGLNFKNAIVFWLHSFQKFYLTA